MKKKEDQEKEVEESGTLSTEDDTDQTVPPSEEENDSQTEAGDSDTKLKREVEELRSKFLLKAAEFDNYRKRTRKDLANIALITEGEVVASVLEVLDDMDRAEADESEEIQEGVRFIFNKFRKILKNKGLKEMECLHEEFNPETQEAIAHIPAPSEDLKNKIIDVTEKGYYLKDRLIRHAKVVVGK